MKNSLFLSALLVFSSACVFNASAGDDTPPNIVDVIQLDNPVDTQEVVEIDTQEVVETSIGTLSLCKNAIIKSCNMVVDSTVDCVVDNPRISMIFGISTVSAITAAAAVKVSGAKMSKKKAALSAWLLAMITSTGYFYGQDAYDCVQSYIAGN